VIVIITDEAELDLEEIGDYIARDSKRRAVTFVNELVDRCELLAGMRNSFPLVSGHEHTGVRRRPYGEYLIFYSFDDTGVKVLRILNSARDHESIVFPEP
jgi:plasmid stabilization system protein ParE